MRTFEYLILNYGLLVFGGMLALMLLMFFGMLWLMERSDARRSRKSPPVDPDTNELDDLCRRVRESAKMRRESGLGRENASRGADRGAPRQEAFRRNAA